ncbi:MAG: hypothetical protein CL436_03110 [Acidimicrobiaceae bacterium]|nr:hypothetical protein [Acidimicrobiaceae bacterium]
MHFVIYDVDRPDAGNLRAETRARHLGYLAAYEMHFAGPLLDSDGEMCGSLMVIDLPSRVEAVDFAGGDPYAIAGLFESSSITTFRQVFPPPEN